MSKLKYSFQGFDEKTMAKARLNNAEVSRKKSIEICNMIRYKTTKKAIQILEEVLEMKRAVPYKSFNRSVAHKTDVGPGRYPIKTVEEILKLIRLAQSNAQNKGLSQDLIIKHLAANKGNMSWHHSRQSRRQMKVANIEIVVSEKAAKKAESKHAEKKSEAPKQHEEIKKETHQTKAPEIEKESKSPEKPKKTAEKAKSESKPKARKTEVKKE
jgi:large subunit ribosomal protein L22